MFMRYLFIGLLCCTLTTAHAQGTLRDYQRSETLKKQLADRAYHIPRQINWQENGTSLVYMIQTTKGKEYIQVDGQTGKRSNAFDQEGLARQLGQALGKTIPAYQLPIQSLKRTPTGFSFDAEGSQWTYDAGQLRKKGSLSTLNRYWGDRSRGEQVRRLYTPDSSHSAIIKNYNVYIRNERSKEEFPMSFDGSEGEYYSSDLRWSPDGTKLAGTKTRKNTPHLIYLIRSSPTDQLQPKLETRNYLKPGDALPIQEPVLFDITSRKQLPIAMDLIAQQYELSDPDWRADSKTFTLEYNQRGHQVYRVLEVEASTGRIRPLIEEKSKTFIDYSGKRFRHDTPDGREIIWASERDGWNHLYLYDAAKAQVKNQITKGNWVVRNVVHVDDAKRTILFAASGQTPDEDPYYLHYYQINFDGKGLKALTPEVAQHEVMFSPDFSTFVDTYSRINQAPVTVLRKTTDGSIITTLEKADLTEWEKAGWKAPEPFVAKARDQQTDIHGIIIRPTNFDPSRKYPVIEMIYAGPQSAFVPKAFSTNTAMHELAELGFVVVQIDGMGTSNRSKAFHDVCWKNLKDAGFPDRILWMKAAAQKYPYLDLERVGVYGTSAGGQNAAGAVLFQPDFYKVAVASCGCHDNRMDKMWWNEQWMGYPIGPQYAECSNVTHADQLRGELLLIVGEMDDNVDPSSTYQLADALIRANKNFELVVVPNMGHSAGGDFGERKRRDFFVRHLLNVQPPRWNAAPVAAEETPGKTSRSER
ncbi:S9 family peptidase [Siphonobacter curvatus]|uniref:S9 family peptidase n=2 Tax=Siphonobacter curvatus TaxID=2094562 RepID=A0A2S7IGV7_9BACT|nr:S9 family peptidase [Siphonobacter curvatus]